MRQRRAIGSRFVTSRLGVKSQTVVPKEVRAALGVGPGDQIGYSIQNGRVILTAIKRPSAQDDPSPASTNGPPRPIPRAMPRFELWDVVAVPFPYVERPIRQRRPALVVAAGLGAPHDLLWVLMITAAANPAGRTMSRSLIMRTPGFPSPRWFEPPRSPPSKLAPRASSEAFKGKLLLESPLC